jgi:hypothetical protein
VREDALMEIRLDSAIAEAEAKAFARAEQDIDDPGIQVLSMQSAM